MLSRQEVELSTQIREAVAAAQVRVEQALLDAEATAVYLNMSEEWVRKAAREGRLPSVKVGVNLRFRRSSLDRWIARNERKVTAL